MSSIRQYQRRALEALKPKRVIPLELRSNDVCYLNGKQIYLLGISEGIGTCSDLKGTNIAVFGWEPEYRGFHWKKVERFNCEWAALVRKPTKQKLQTECDHPEHVSCLVVEGIEISKIENKEGYYCMNFIFTGKKKIYVNTIG